MKISLLGTVMISFRFVLVSIDYIVHVIRNSTTGVPMSIA